MWDFHEANRMKDEPGAKIQIAKINLLNVSCRFESGWKREQMHNVIQA